jgi:glycosyltransferase involved in cell wall biosynthesis
MRILHVTRENEADRRFGIGRSLAPVIRELETRGHHVRYLYQNDLGQAARRWQQRLVYRLSGACRYLWGHCGPILLHVWLERLNMGRLAAGVASREDYDCVHLHDPWLAFGYWLSRPFYGNPKARWGMTEHGFGSYTQATMEEGVDYSNSLLRWHHRLERFILARADWVTCPTDTAQIQLQRDLQLTRRPAHWHVISHARPELPRDSKQAARAALGWQDTDFHVLAIGRIAPVKRFPLLIDACIAAQRPMTLTILGNGDPAPLQQQLDRAGAHGIRLQTLSADHALLATHLSAADIYVSTSLNESFGLANTEALAHGLPAICTAVGGVAEATGGGAWLVPGSPDAIGHAIRQLHDDPGLRHNWSGIAAYAAGQLPHATDVTTKYEILYQEADRTPPNHR